MHCSVRWHHVRASFALLWFSTCHCQQQSGIFYLIVLIALISDLTTQLTASAPHTNDTMHSLSLILVSTRWFHCSPSPSSDPPFASSVPTFDHHILYFIIIQTIPHTRLCLNWLGFFLFVLFVLFLTFVSVCCLAWFCFSSLNWWWCINFFLTCLLLDGNFIFKFIFSICVNVLVVVGWLVALSFF